MIAGLPVQRRVALAVGNDTALLAGITLGMARVAVVLFTDTVSVRILPTALHGIGLSAVGVHLWIRAAGGGMGWSPVPSS